MNISKIKPMRELTAAAKASKAIKAELKKEFPNVKFSVKSSNFSMGDSVNISWIDGPTSDKVEAITSKYQYGHFNGMDDIYENTNDRSDIPQSKYVHCARTITKEYFNIVRPLIADIWIDANSYDIDSYAMRILRKHDIYSPVTGITSNGVKCGQVEDLYNLTFAEVEKPKEVFTGSFELVDYSEKAIALFGDTKPIKEALMDLNGRFNRNLKYKDGKKAGWVFSKKIRSNVEALINSDSLAPGQLVEKIEINLYDSLLKKAESTQQASDKIDASVKGNWTHRRQSMADSMKSKKENIERTAKILFSLADMWKAGTIENKFKFIKSRADVEFVTTNSFPPPPDPQYNGWYAEEYPKLKAKVDKMGITSKDQFNLLKEELKALGANEKTPEQIKAEKIEALELKMRCVKIPGFFPTPNKLIDQLLDKADIQPMDIVLDPEAGLGHIVDKVKESYPDNEIYCIEINYTLCEVLKAKGFEVIDNDFLQYSNGRTYDKIIMNPPFENSQDIEHLKHAYSLLNPDGRVVCVMAANKKDDFNNWLDSVGGYFEPNDSNSFQGAEAFRSTGINTITVVINK